MIKKLSMICIVGALSFGSLAMATPKPDPPTIDECLQLCDPFLVLPGGAACVLSGCLEVGETVLCGYSCFYPLPDPIF